jgi:hypothetical protein
MAVYKIFPEKSATIYSFYPTLNTGNDEILEISTLESINNSNEVSRTLIKFPLSTINTVMNLVSNSNFTASLKLYLADGSSVPTNFILETHPLALDWSHGTGRLGNVPATTDGVSWEYRSEEGVNPWPTSSFPIGTTASYSPSGNAGGGVWWTASLFYNNQQFLPKIAPLDTNINVSQVVNAWHGNVITNYGLIVKHQSSYEFSTASKYELKYFSEHTHTIYPPSLDIYWDDSSFSTGSLTVVTSSYFTAVINNNKAEYQQDSIQKFRIAVRDLYPSTTFRTSLNFNPTKCLPSSSYWSIKDLDTEEIIVDYSVVGTKISCDATGNFFTVYMNGLEPERYYKMLIKSVLANGETVVIDKDYIFKVVR